MRDLLIHSLASCIWERWKIVKLGEKNPKSNSCFEGWELVRKVFEPLSSLAKNDPADWWEVKGNVSYLYYLCNVGAGRKTHHIAIQQFCLAITILTGNRFSLCLVHDVIWNDTTEIAIFCNLHSALNMTQQSNLKGCVKKHFQVSWHAEER